MSRSPFIETERLILTWPTYEQIKAYYDIIIGTNMFDTLKWDGPSGGPEDLYSYWDACRKTNIENIEENLPVAIIEKNSKCYIGGADLRTVNGDYTQIDIGFALAPKYHGKGYATEAIKAMVSEAFKNRKAERVFANVFVGNASSRRVVEKLGFQLEGTLRRVSFKQGNWLDEWLLAITRPDWESLRIG